MVTCGEPLFFFLQCFSHFTIFVVFISFSFYDSFCPASVELNDVRRDNKRRVFYVLPISELYKLHHSNSSDSSNSNNSSDFLQSSSVPMLRFRTYTEICKAIALRTAPLLHKNKRLSENEIRRRQIVESYCFFLKQNNPATIAKLWQLLGPVSEIDQVFFGLSDYPTLEPRASLSSAAASQLISAAAFVSSGTSSSKEAGFKGKSRSRAPSLNGPFESTVMMATSRRHWVEYYLTINKNEIQLYKGAESRRIVHCIQQSSVLSVKPLSPEETPIPECAFFQIETFPRIFYFMVHSVAQRNDCLEAFTRFFGRGISNSPFDKQFDSSTQIAQVTEVAFLSVHSPRLRKLKTRSFFLAGGR